MNGRLLGLVVATVALLAICIFLALRWTRQGAMKYVRLGRKKYNVRIQRSAYEVV